MAGFVLHERLGNDSVPVGDLALCRVLLMNDARFPWLILAPRRCGLVDIDDLAAPERAMLIEEIARASAALRAITGADKINVGALGNIVRQLHVHIVARFATDSAWPGPVWGAGAAQPYAPGAAEALVALLRRKLGVSSAEELAASGST